MKPPTASQMEETKPDSDIKVQFTTTNNDGNESETKRSYHDISDSEDGARPGSLIEGMFDVERRKNQPIKKIKTDDPAEENTLAPQKTVAISSNSGLGQWMKEGEAKPGTTPTPGLSDVVDLTAGMIFQDEKVVSRN